MDQTGSGGGLAGDGQKVNGDGWRPLGLFGGASMGCSVVLAHKWRTQVDDPGYRRRGRDP